MGVTPEEILAKIAFEFPKVEKAPSQVKTYLTLKLSSSGEIVPLCRFLKDRFGFQYLDMVTAVDWKGPVDARGYIMDPNPNPFLPEGATPQVDVSPPTPGVNYREAFELVYVLSHLDERIKIFLKLEIPRSDPNVPSLTGLFKTADWQEREAYDLLGIGFLGHPDLRKILTPDFIRGHPLRKDYVHTKDRFD